MLRAVILAATAAALICMYLDKPTPVKAAQVVPYCIIDFKAAFKDRFGQWRTQWVEGYGMCSLQDIYREI